MRPVIALFRGEGHVLVDGNDEERAVVPPEAFGVPVREFFPEPKYRLLQAVMDAVWRDGRPRVLPFQDGAVTVVLLRDRQGRRLGVGTRYAERAPVSRLRPRDLASGLGELVGVLPLGT